MYKTILVYDINTEDKAGKKRLDRIKKAARKYLHHIQKSVFEGEITHKKLQLLKRDILNIIDPKKDDVIIYTTTYPDQLQKEMLTETADKTSYII